MEIYKIENLTFTYPDRERPALQTVNLTIKRGEFITICGPSGCGKTTLLRQLKPSAVPHGLKSGAVYFINTPINELTARDAAAKIGFVMQSPDNQIVTDKVWHELAFGLESLGYKTPEIRLRVAETASFFGIQTWFHKPVAELSGGQKQLLALASIMVLQPSVLILDEPTSQLDPIAAGEFLTAVGKINRDLGVTVILTEHRLEEVFPLSTRAVVMDVGTVIADGSPREVGLALRGQNHGMFLAMPAAMRVWAACDDVGCCPVTVNEGANWLVAQSVNSGKLPLVTSFAAVCPEQNTNNRSVGTERNILLYTAKNEDNTPPDAAEEENMSSDAAKEENTPSDAAKSGENTPSDATKTEVNTPSNTAKIRRNTQSNTAYGKPAIELKDIWFKYERNLPDVVKGLSFTAHYGEITAILGGNGTGKTTTLTMITGLNTPYRGKVTTDAQAYALPQNPQSLFVAKTLREDLLEILSERNIPKDEKLQRLAEMVTLCRLDGLLDSHPYDLSGGEQQRAALAKVLLLQPKILLLDEPTKGFDAEFKQVFAAILRSLTDAGAAVVIASHDVEFCAEYADRCALFFDGNIVTENTARVFFAGNSFYTTSANRMAREVLPEAVIASDIVRALGGYLPPPPEIIDIDAKYEIEQPKTPSEARSSKLPKSPKPSTGRKATAGVFTLCLIVTVLFAAFNLDGFISFISGGGEAVSIAAEGAWLYIGIMLSFAVEIAGITYALTWKREKIAAPQIVMVKREPSKRTAAAAAMILLAIPITIYIGSYFFGDRKYYFISLLIILETMLPFALVFESRKPRARELVVLAVLCAIAVAGRAAFFMLPQFKPVVALVIIAGVAFGSEAGFLVGAITGFVSNMFFGQGPWTPWQMFAFGIIGFLAGLLFSKGLLNRASASLAVFGAFSTFIIYGLIIDTSMIVLYQTNINPAMLLAALLQGIPFNLVHAAATVTFLAIIARPMLEKLDRIKLKYGLME